MGQAAAAAGADEQEEGYLLRPMNCPHHIQIYKSLQRSYRDLPLRLAEFGSVYRMEQSGELSGLIRVRGFTQDDAHIFCAPEQLAGEIASCVDLVKLVLGTLGLGDYRVRIGLRDPDSSKYVGDPANWQMAEQNLRQVVAGLGLNYAEEPGEAAFYGPKIDFIVKDCLGRQWQLGTIQVDYNLPERFGLEYTGADNALHRPVMIHRAPFGSLERFIGILIEHFAGAFPPWLSPVQVAVLPVSEKFMDYAGKVLEAARSAGLRAEVDGSADKVAAKVRRWTLQKVPYLFIVGQREREAQTVSIRRRSAGEAGTAAVAEAVAALRAEVDSRSSAPAFAGRS
jgi:threonyl-tRNA synthetase